MSTLPRMLPLFDVGAFEAVCAQWADNSAGAQGVWEGEDGPQEDRPLVTFSLLTCEDIMTPTRNDVYNATSQKIERGYYKLQLARLQVMAMTDSNKPMESAQRICEQMVTALYSDTYKEALFNPNGIGVGNTTTTRRVPIVEDGVRWKSKAVFEVELTVACNQDSVENITPITSVQSDGTLGGGVNGDISLTETIPDV